jgi:hypothetical protein
MKPTPIPLPRRQFLRQLSATAVSTSLPAWLPLSLAACGGGSSPAPAADPPRTPTDASGDTARAAALRGVEDRCRALAQQGLAPLPFVQAVAAHLRTQPAYVEVGVDEATLTAWGVFADGRVHLIANNHVPQRRTSAAAPRARALAAPVETPTAATARVLQSFGADFDGADVVADLSGWLHAKGYALRAGDQNTAHVEALRQVGGDGCFYINTHGGAFASTLFPGSDQISYSIQSSTLVSAAQEADPAMRADLDARRLTYFTAHNGGTFLGFIDDWDTRYGITAAFVDAYWHFAPDSVVLINACSSARTGESKWAAGFVFACHRAGAGVYLGWNETVTPTGAYRAARYFTCRLLGANAYQPEVPAQRAFAWDSVMADMQRKGLHLDPGGNATFLALPRPGSATVQQLAPGIHHVEIDEYRDELTLHGSFGSTPGTVTVAQQPRRVLEWTPTRIVCDLPLTGPGAAGAVQVRVRGVASNLRQISEWTLDLDYTWVVMETQGLKVSGPGRIRLRADIGATREDAGEVPAQPLRQAIATRDSRLPLAASGSLPTGACTLNWTGNATYNAIPMAGDGRGLVAYFRVDTATKQAALGLALSAAQPDFTQTCGPVSSGFQAIFGPLDQQVGFASPVPGSSDVIPLHALALPLGSDWRIAADTRQTVLVRLRWGEVVPSFPPLPDDGV